MGKYDQYKESAFTHEEMQPMIIETDMTDIVERLRIGRETCGVDMCRIREAKSGCTCAEAADEIERLRTENQELKLQYLSDQGQWIEETGRLRAALRGIACTDDTCECGYVEGEGPFCELGRARAALGEKE